jgi:hypothetical protein
MTLRAPRPHQIEYSDDAQAKQEQIEQKRGTKALPFAIAVGLGLLAVAFVLVSGGQTSTASAPTMTPMRTVIAEPVREIVVVTATPIPTPDCVAATTQLSVIDALIQKGNWEEAAREADATLTIPRLCQNDEHLLSQKAVTAGLYVLLNQEFEPLDTTGHQQTVDRYLALRERAKRANVELPSALQVARTAYSTSQFRLTIAAIELALSVGEYDPQLDRDTTKLYISALYSAGYWYTKAPKESKLFEMGTSFLSASHRLAVQHKTGQADAATLLTRLFGSAEDSWPAPYHSPLFGTH